MPAVQVIRNVVKPIVAQLARFSIRILELPITFWRCLVQPHTGERRVDYLAVWITFFTVCLGGTVFGILALVSNSTAIRLARESNEYAKASQELAELQFSCTGSVSFPQLAVSFAPSLTATDQNVSAEVRSFCDKYREDMLHEKMHPIEWISSSAQRLWKFIALKLPIGWCGFAALREEYTETCVGISILIFSVWLRQNRSPQLSLIGGLMTLVSGLYAMIAAVRIFMFPFDSFNDPTMPEGLDPGLWAKGLICYFVWVTFVECLLTRKCHPERPLTQILMRLVRKICVGVLLGSPVTLICNADTHYLADNPLLVIACCVYAYVIWLPATASLYLEFAPIQDCSSPRQSKSQHDGEGSEASGRSSETMPRTEAQMPIGKGRLRHPMRNSHARRERQKRRNKNTF